MIPNLPQLSFVPVDSLVIHERHDDERTLPLIKRIRSSGVFRNPPVVTPLQDGTDRYMVLDGANRTTALQKMGYPHALVQVVQPDDPGLSLQNWNHVVWELNPDRFMSNIQKIEDIQVDPIPEDSLEPDLWGSCGLVLIHLCDFRMFTLCCSSKELVKRVSILNAIVDSYRTCSRLDRTMVRSARPLVDVYPNLSGLVIFPKFKIHDLLRLSGDGCLLPTGITRFTISPRALHINYPLQELAADKPVEEKNAALYQWIQDRLARKRVRYYAEATFLFDE
jgi:L-serine kinase (ATP) / ParB family transcriptional regulator, heme-responsive regulator